MRLFRFHRDLLFLVGCAAYAVNRLILKPHLHSPFLHSHFNDLWLIPCALPLVLWVHWRLGWRSDKPPTFLEVASHLCLWSLLFEWWGPHLMHHVTGDLGDVVCYWAGGIVAWAWWNRAELSRRHAVEGEINHGWTRMDADEERQSPVTNQVDRRWTQAADPLPQASMPVSV